MLLNVLINYVQHAKEEFSIDYYTLLNLFEPKAIAVQNWEKALSSLTSAVPAMRVIGLNDFPDEIKDYLDELLANKKDKDTLYEIAEAVVQWLSDSPEEYQTRLAIELCKMPSTASRILIVSLRNAEFQISNNNLLYAIGSFLESTDKLLAQSSAACLLACGGSLGESIVQTALYSQDLPHSRLIQGIMGLLS
ncbi:hypothetical protein [uncultured Nostoc sp.]|uniref:hypothetical protein n=1 Tax=uncultured Nostoc sp. TaxID=340711 RepID=UPI002604E588|nr:hypothetical protein [uncultured Nostoc sp.]